MKRRRPHGFLRKVKEVFWPSMGWIRTFRYYRHRMFRTGDSNYKITAGLAMGAAISFTPFLGTHILQAIFLSWLIRASLVGGLVGTFIGNPWTYPIMFIAAYKVGVFLCSFLGLGSFDILPPGISVADADHEPWAFLVYMFEHPVRVFLPLTIGGYFCTAIFWPVFYILFYCPVCMMRGAYIHRRRRKGARQ